MTLSLITKEEERQIEEMEDVTESGEWSLISERLEDGDVIGVYGANVVIELFRVSVFQMAGKQRITRQIVEYRICNNLPEKKYPKVNSFQMKRDALFCAWRYCREWKSLSLDKHKVKKRDIEEMRRPELREAREKKEQERNKKKYGSDYARLYRDVISRSVEINPDGGIA